MAVKKPIRLLSFLLLIIFAFQLLPLISGPYDAVTFPMEKTKAEVLPYNPHDHSVILSKEDREPPLKLVIPRLYKLFDIPHYSNYSLHSFNQKGVVIDFRQILRSSILKSFHGSKYKVTVSR